MLTLLGTLGLLVTINAVIYVFGCDQTRQADAPRIARPDWFDEPVPTGRAARRGRV